MEVALKAQELEGIRAQMADWEKTKDEWIKTAHAGTLSAARELSSKLLEDHKRESIAAKKEDEERIKKTTENLVGQVKEVTNIIVALQSHVDASKEKTDIIWRALSTPGGAGHSTQVILGNTLKSLGLEEYRDFVLDKAPEGSRRRPDAIVFLPGDTVLVVDAKASKFLLDVAEAEKNEGDETEALEKLAITMNQHLKELMGKNYEAEVKNSYREAGRTNEAKIIMSLMYLPNEGAIERVGKADPKFADKALEHRIAIVGPMALRFAIGLASKLIDSGRRVEFQEQIVETTQNLLNNLHIVLDHAGRVGKGLKSASENYGKLVSSVNTRLLPQMKRLIQQGVKPIGHKSTPKSLPRFEVLVSEDGQLIDAEVEEVNAVPAIENLSNDAGKKEEEKDEE
jgi:DNA recombination protein RmuC